MMEALLMKKDEKGITLLSLVITIIVLSILASVLVSISITENPLIDEIQASRNYYNEQKEQTETRVNSMVQGWEDVIL